ncbi:MAG: ABC transporter ATP-binding protein [Desulfobacteraceae bacterium]|nr:ABC transporter ATP-binding protein [Desulfobacteraceae bacterium]
MALISVENLGIGYLTKNGFLRAINNVSFQLEQGDSLGFVGESGCGKTTIGMALMGLLPENANFFQGSIWFQNKDLTIIEEQEWRDIRGKEISMIFQAAMNALNPVIKVDEQIIEAITAHHPELSSQQVKNRVNELFDLVEIPAQRKSDYPHEYSGGMKQRAIIAMALACNPKLIIADEPTTALDVIVQDQILKEIKKIQNKLNTSLIFISHDIAVVAEVCEYICVMYGGQIVETGTRKEVFCSPKHPYTRTLLSSYLHLDNQEDIKVPDIRETPDLIIRSSACRFCGSCNCQSIQCTSGTPNWIDFTSTHKAYCFKDNLEKKNDE